MPKHGVSSTLKFGRVLGGIVACVQVKTVHVFSSQPKANDDEEPQ
jgi:hypothetical protein